MTFGELRGFLNSLGSELDTVEVGAVNVCPDCIADNLTYDTEDDLLVIYTTDDHGESEDE